MDCDDYTYVKPKSKFSEPVGNLTNLFEWFTNERNCFVIVVIIIDNDSPTTESAEHSICND